jgi:hypothetical protein
MDEKQKELVEAWAKHDGQTATFEKDIVILDREYGRGVFVYRPDLPEGDYFGDCPDCWRQDGNLKTDGYVNVRKDHFFVCHKHKKYWNAGYNLMSSWQYETEEEWRANAAMLSTYAEAEPVVDFKIHALYYLAMKGEKPPERRRERSVLKGKE